MDKLTFDGIEVKVVKKRIKNMYLRINSNGEAVVSAPVFLSDEKIKEFVFSRKEWIKEALFRRADGNNKNEVFGDGAEVGLFGKTYTLKLDTSRFGSFYFKDSCLYICVGENSTEESRRKIIGEVYRQAMEQILPEFANRCQKTSGLYADEWRLRDMKTRWGSCNTREKRIWISIWLASKPLECLEAVIYHELTHLKIKGHGKDFYALLERNCPEYKNIIRKM